LIKTKKAQVAVEFIVLLLFVAPIAIYLINYINNKVMKPFADGINNDLKCMVRYGYSCLELGVTFDEGTLSSIDGAVPLDVNTGTTHPWDKVEHAW